MIYDKEPIDALWNIVKSLKKQIPIYKETMDEDMDNTPDSYLLLRSDVSNSTLLFGDGKTQIRRADCDIILVTKGVSNNSASDLHHANKAKVNATLETAQIAYSGANLGYDETLKSTQYAWSLVISYGKS